MAPLNTLSLLSLSLLSGSSLVQALPPPLPPATTDSPNLPLTVTHLDIIAPKASNASYCPQPENTRDEDAAALADECRRNDQIVDVVNKAFEKYGVESNGEKAALISLEAFESGEWKYNRNHFPAPGRPGQGTRGMLMFPHIYNYALSIPELHDCTLNQAPNPPNATWSPSNETMNGILAQVLPDEYSFASVVWYYKEGGPEACREEGMVKGLEEGSEDGWKNYIETCVETTVDDDRKEVWLRAKDALMGEMSADV